MDWEITSLRPAEAGQLLVNFRLYDDEQTYVYSSVVVPADAPEPEVLKTVREAAQGLKRAYEGEPPRSELLGKRGKA
jgi:hypothetical protein